MKTQCSTDEFTISLMTLDDIPLLLELDQDPEVMRYLNGGRPTTMDEIEQRVIPRVNKFHTPEKGWGLWKVVANTSKNLPAELHQQFLGWILIRPMGFFTAKTDYDNLEIGWRFKKMAWGYGIATRSATAVMDHITAHTSNITAFSAIAVPENTASIGVMNKLGMTFVEKTFDAEFTSVEVVLYTKILDRKKPI